MAMVRACQLSKESCLNSDHCCPGNSTAERGGRKHIEHLLYEDLAWGTLTYRILFNLKEGVIMATAQGRKLKFTGVK